MIPPTHPPRDPEHPETLVFDAMRTQLDDSFVVFHGVKRLWYREVLEEGEADFIVAHPDLGVLVIEVKGGDVIYEAARDRWVRKLGNGDLRPVTDPFRQAHDGEHWLVERLDRIPGSRSWLPNHGHAVVFPQGTYAHEVRPDAPVSIVIDGEQMDVLGPRVRQIMADWRAGRENRFGTAGMAELRRSLYADLEIVVPLGRRMEDAERRMVDLNHEQRYLLELLKTNHPRAAVRGGAGSGKSLLAIEIARWLGEQGRDTLLTCFNKRLAAHLREALAGVGGLTITHFHDLAATMVAEAGLDPGTDPDGDDARGDDEFFHQRMPTLLVQAAAALPGRRFDAVVVDEAQDFRAAYWDAVLALHHTPHDGPLYAFLDDAQNIYHGDPLPLEDDEILPPLRANMRNSYEIQSFLLTLQRRLTERPSEEAPSFGPVRIVAYDGEEELVTKAGAAVRGLLDAEVDLADVALLTPYSVERSLLRGRDALAGVPLSEEPEPETLMTSSVHGFKGLERNAIVLAEIGHHSSRRLLEYLYVGSSRAQMSLTILAVPDQAGLLLDFPDTAPA